MGDKSLLEVEDLKVYFPLRRSLKDVINKVPPRYMRAVDGVSFSIDKGTTLGLVGESGCGKSTIGKSIVRLIRPYSGHIYYDGIDITEINAGEAKEYSKKIQYIFQDPYSSLNPKMTILEIVRRPLEIFNICEPAGRSRRALELLDMTGISPSQAQRYPSEFSGGQRQRISIARAIAVEPELIIADEPTSALDVSIQCQILDLLTDLQRNLGLTLLFISHDLSVINYITENVQVMYLGQMVESGNTSTVFHSPLHPYTKALIEALPKRGSINTHREMKLAGYIPSPINPPSGCLLHPRCPYAQFICSKTAPESICVNGTKVRCHFAKDGGFKKRILPITKNQ